ncbi:MAG: rhodanese-like domain-containing protein [Proteobacteria bacterium]|nr:rhodanese-like domain-containing protein [Pseudomonadota bacterium]
MYNVPPEGGIVQTHQISVQELSQRLKAKECFFLLDVRNLDEYQVFNLGGHLLPLAELPQRITELPKDQPIIIYCRSGYRSQVALEFLQSVGFTQLSNLIGGVLAWQQAYGMDL